MRFDTLYFAAFFICVYLSWRIVPWRGLVLLVASVVFYAAETGRRDPALFALLIAANYGLAFAAHRIWGLLAGIVLNIGALAFFKYRQFLLPDTIFQDTAVSGLFLNFAIPLGISFYTFQAVAYLVDIHRGRAEPVAKLHHFALFKGFFPQLIAGPIVRAHELLPQLARQWAGNPRRHRLITWGLAIACMGVIKKVVFADSIAPFVDDIFHNGPNDSLTAWIGAGLFGFQIYFDFSGYSDMALGMAYLLSIRLPLNFRQPYLATSPREFWRRWHITLSSWIRDYLYIPLGGGRGAPLRQVLVLVGVMALAGFWHGASWTFIVWGTGWGLVVAAWRWTPLGRLPAALGRVATLLVASTLWVPFRSADFSTMLAYLKTMYGGAASGSASYGLLAAVGLGSLLALHRLEAAADRPAFIWRLRRLNTPLVWGALVAIIAWLLIMPKAINQPFIYFRF